MTLHSLTKTSKAVTEPCAEGASRGSKSTTTAKATTARSKMSGRSMPRTSVFPSMNPSGSRCVPASQPLPMARRGLEDFAWICCSRLLVIRPDQHRGWDRHRAPRTAPNSIRVTDGDALIHPDSAAEWGTADTALPFSLHQLHSHPRLPDHAVRIVDHADIGRGPSSVAEEAVWHDPGTFLRQAHSHALDRRAACPRRSGSHSILCRLGARYPA